MIAVYPETPEFTVLARLTGRPDDKESVRTLLAAVGQDIDWTRFIALVERHRVGPLCYDGLSRVRDVVPDAVNDVLRAIARRDRTTALAGIAALTAASGCLSAAGIGSLSIKGPTLGMLAFGDASVRQFKDIDILIEREHVSRAIAVLTTAGFRLLTPRGADDPRRLRSWAWLMKDVGMMHEASGTLVELHWRLNQNPYLLDSAVGRSRRAVALGSQRFDTLARDDLLLYLCVHGAEHFWFRLKWLADVAALLAALSPGEITAFHDNARSGGLAIPAGQMLLMVEQVYGLSIPANVRAMAMSSWRVRLLTRFALRAVHEITEHGEVRFASTVQAMAHMLLRPSPGYIGRDLLNMVIDWPVALALSRSRWGIPIAIFGRPVFWLIRKARPAPSTRQ